MQGEPRGLLVAHHRSKTSRDGPRGAPASRPHANPHPDASERRRRAKPDQLSARELAEMTVAGERRARPNRASIAGFSKICHATEQPNNWHRLLLLRPRRDRPGRRRCATDERNELAPFHSITLSARTSSSGGMVRPSALAVLRLMTNCTFVG